MVKQAKNNAGCWVESRGDAMQSAHSRFPKLPSKATSLMAQWCVAVAMVLGLSSSLRADVVEYYHLDMLGSVRAVTDGAAQVVERHDYAPFGEECTTGDCASNPQAGSGQPKKFTGKERDVETGFDYFGARYYSPLTGRFSGIDPALTIEKNILDPERWNRYVYGRNNPLRFVDPNGEDSVDWIGGNPDTIWTQVGTGVSNGAYNFVVGIPNTATWMSSTLGGCSTCSQQFMFSTRQGTTPIEILSEAGFHIGITLLPLGPRGGGGATGIGVGGAPGAGTQVSIAGLRGIALSRRLTATEMANMQRATGLEHALVYMAGAGKNGGGGSYLLFRGTATEFSIPVGASVRLISHTHPRMLPGGWVTPLWASGKDRSLMSKLQEWGSPQRVSTIVPEIGTPFRFSATSSRIR